MRERDKERGKEREGERASNPTERTREMHGAVRELALKEVAQWRGMC